MPRKKKIKKHKSKNLLHVRIKAPLEARKDLLESALEIINLLKDLEKVKHIEKEKEKLSTKFLNQVRDLEKSLSSLKRELPNINVDRIIGEQAKDINIEQIDDEADLMRELKEVEAKINALEG